MSSNHDFAKLALTGALGCLAALSGMVMVTESGITPGQPNFPGEDSS